MGNKRGELTASVACTCRADDWNVLNASSDGGLIALRVGGVTISTHVSL